MFGKMMKNYPTVSEDDKKDTESCKSKLRDFIAENNCVPLMIKLAQHAATNSEDPIGSDLDVAVRLLKPIKEQFPNFCEAYFYQLAGDVAVEITAGIEIPFQINVKKVVEEMRNRYLTVGEDYKAAMVKCKSLLKGLMDENNCAPVMIHMAWHFVTQGVIGMTRNAADGGADRDFCVAVRLLEPIRMEFPILADNEIILLAGIVAIEIIGGIKISFYTKRETPTLVAEQGRKGTGDKDVSQKELRGKRTADVEIDQIHPVVIVQGWKNTRDKAVFNTDLRGRMTEFVKVEIVHNDLKIMDSDDKIMYRTNLPEGVNPKNTNAYMEKGVLIVELDKTKRNIMLKLMSLVWGILSDVGTGFVATCLATEFSG